MLVTSVLLLAFVSLIAAGIVELQRRPYAPGDARALLSLLITPTVGFLGIAIGYLFRRPATAQDGTVRV